MVATKEEESVAAEEEKESVTAAEEEESVALAAEEEEVAAGKQDEAVAAVSTAVTAETTASSGYSSRRLDSPCHNWFGQLVCNFFVK